MINDDSEMTFHFLVLSLFVLFSQLTRNFVIEEIEQVFRSCSRSHILLGLPEPGLEKN